MSKIQMIAAALVLSHEVLETLNRQCGGKTIQSVAVNIGGTNLYAGDVKGHVVRENGDKRMFSMKLKDSGKVNVRFLNKRKTFALPSDC